MGKLHENISAPLVSRVSMCKIGRIMSTSNFEGRDLAWRKASRSVFNGECVEVASAPGYVAIRDSKSPAFAVLESSPRRWQAFLLGVKQGVFDMPS
jgi:hypothetical protein